MSMRIRRYSELQRLESFEERFEYLNLVGNPGDTTFGFERYLNQNFYRSAQWKKVRNDVIARDYGRDLGCSGFDIFDKIIVHHMNPMTSTDIIGDDDDILDSEFLITTSHQTHNAIHYGDRNSIDSLINPVISRAPGDTTLWSRN